MGAWGVTYKNKENIKLKRSNRKRAHSQGHLPEDTGSCVYGGMWYHRPCRQLVDKKGQESIITLKKKNIAGRTSEGHHFEVVTGHELDVHRLPLSSRVRGPSNLTSASLIEDLSRIRNCRIGISQDNQCQGQNEGRESARTRKHGEKTFRREVY